MQVAEATTTPEPWQAAQEHAELLEALRTKLTALRDAAEILRPHIDEPCDDLYGVLANELRSTADAADQILFPLILTVRRSAVDLKASREPRTGLFQRLKRRFKRRTA